MHLIHVLLRWKKKIKNKNVCKLWHVFQIVSTWWRSEDMNGFHILSYFFSLPDETAKILGRHLDVHLSVSWCDTHPLCDKHASVPIVFSLNDENITYHRVHFSRSLPLNHKDNFLILRVIDNTTGGIFWIIKFKINLTHFMILKNLHCIGMTWLTGWSINFEIKRSWVECPRYSPFDLRHFSCKQSSFISSYASVLHSWVFKLYYGIPQLLYLSKISALYKLIRMLPCFAWIVISQRAYLNWWGY